jgi:hypothetical protein
MPGEIHEVGGVFPIMDREIGIEPDLLRIVAQDPRADSLKRECRVSGSIGAPVAKHQQYRLKQDFDVEPRRPPIDILNVVVDAFS